MLIDAWVIPVSDTVFTDTSCQKLKPHKPKELNHVSVLYSPNVLNEYGKDVLIEISGGYSYHHSTRLIAKYRFYIDLRLAALDNIFARQKGLPPDHAISSS